MQAARHAGHAGVDHKGAIARADRRTRRCPDQDVEMPHRASSQVQDAAIASASYAPHNSHPPGAPMSVANSVNWFELYVQDMPRARAFYVGVLGIALEPLKLLEGGDEGLEMWSFPVDMERYGANGALCRMPGVPSGPGGTLVYFAC